MRYFNLLNIRHIVLAVFPVCVCVILIGVALAFSCFHNNKTETRQTQVTGIYPDGIEERNAPFPLFLFLVILGTVLWGAAYIWMAGWTGRAI